MKPFSKVLIPSAVTLLMAACHIPTPPSIPIPSNVYLSLGGASVVVDKVRVEGRLAENGRSVDVQVYNESPADIELLLDEWTLTVDGETSKVFLGITPRHRIGRRPLETVAVPPGELLLMTVGMASRHQNRHPFRGAERITLTFVFERKDVKRSETLEISLSGADPV